MWVVEHPILPLLRDTVSDYSLPEVFFKWVNYELSLWVKIGFCILGQALILQRGMQLNPAGMRDAAT